MAYCLKIPKYVEGKLCWVTINPEVIFKVMYGQKAWWFEVHTGWVQKQTWICWAFNNAMISRELIATLAEVTLNAGLTGIFPQNTLNADLGIIVNSPDDFRNSYPPNIHGMWDFSWPTLCPETMPRPVSLQSWKMAGPTCREFLGSGKGPRIYTENEQGSIGLGVHMCCWSNNSYFVPVLRDGHQPNSRVFWYPLEGLFL